ncbi:histone H1 [Gracilimonas mengyeensis]|uniref:Histone H1-like protein Hc1 n=1 Tax=Gracilimonas mengyeensis TaxID=1302730 RepID=A0A521B9J9_9BACT|nr:histone H1 [Gracilimonas mengyeensis]SMO43776.1 Histone H1-like protein Hc1 [Gracilimonas mengyeensis]
MSRMDDINNVIEELQVDMNKFYEKGNKAAGTRARKHLMNLKNLAHEIRQEIQAKKNAM